MKGINSTERSLSQKNKKKILPPHFPCSSFYFLSLFHSQHNELQQLEFSKFTFEIPFLLLYLLQLVRPKAIIDYPFV